MAAKPSASEYRYLDEKGEHLHTLDGKPLIGTSTVCKIIGMGDGLTWWAAGMAIGKLGWLKKSDSRKGEPDNKGLRLEAAMLTVAKIAQLPAAEYLALLDEAYKAHDTYKRERAKIGTARHEALESYVKACMGTNGGKPLRGEFENEFVQKFADWAHANIKQFLWSELHCYSAKLWTGGIADLGWLSKEDEVVAGDFKSSKEAYFNQFIQIAGYDTEISENGGFTKEGKSMFKLPAPITKYCIIPFGADVLLPTFVNDVEGYKKGFENALSIYKLSESYGR